jgi:hypothetical protein
MMPFLYITIGCVDVRQELSTDESRHPPCFIRTYKAAVMGVWAVGFGLWVAMATEAADFPLVQRHPIHPAAAC